ncbi:MAG: hypothetical protein FWF53_06955 [Candidatus Azobacteroides sp.]|nr:hypothetical protein [Candidatus Azobacteroides sp.]
MKELLIENGWIHYSTGCPCQSLPKYYKHPDYPDYRIVTKGGFGIIKKNGVEIFRTKDIEQFKAKLEELKLTI